MGWRCEDVLYIAAILKSITEVSADNRKIVYFPEAYSAAGGEVFVFAMVTSWILTAIFRPDVLASNSLQERVGYNNLCVGWDTFPAKAIAAPLFVLIIWLNVRHLQLDYWRASLQEGLSWLQWFAIYTANACNAFSWMACIMIFVIDPAQDPNGHAMSFVQLVVFGYLGYAANFIEADPSHLRRGSVAFLIFYGLFSALGGLFCGIQFYMFVEETKETGPIPAWLCASVDYGWFCCLVIKGFMYPRAPSLVATFELIGNKNFGANEVASFQDVEMSPRAEQVPPPT